MHSRWHLTHDPNGKHGSNVRAGKRKCARPLATDRLMHVVYRAKKAQGAKSFLAPGNRRRVAEILDRTARENHVYIVQFKNVVNHFHLLTKARSESGLQRFLRNFPARVALFITGAKKGNAQGRFFDETVFTRIVEWGRDLENMAEYLFKNALESLGLSQREVNFLRSQARRHPGNGIFEWVHRARAAFARSRP